MGLYFGLISADTYRFFNEQPFIEGMKKIFSKQVPDYFNLVKRNLKEKCQWLINFILSVNASLFWAGLVEVSFKDSGDLLKQFDTGITNAIGEQLQKPYVYLFFVICSFYANMTAWPGIHTAAYENKKSVWNWICQCLCRTDPKKEKLEKKNRCIEGMHQRVLEEIENIIKNVSPKERLSGIQIPLINELIKCTNRLDKDSENSMSLNPNVNMKEQIINQLEGLVNLNSTELRQAYLSQFHFNGSGSAWGNLSKLGKCFGWIKRPVSLMFAGLAIYGYRNVIQLSQAIWENWNFKNLSKYALGPLAYYSIAEVVLQTVYPLIFKLITVMQRGIPPYVISRKKMIFIISMVIVVGVFGGLANAEQSYLAGQPLWGIIIGDITAFLTDAFSIFMALNSIFESNIKDAKEATDVTDVKDPKKVWSNFKLKLQKLFLKLEILGKEALAVQLANHLESVVVHSESSESPLGSPSIQSHEKVGSESFRESIFKHISPRRGKGDVTESSSIITPKARDKCACAIL